VLGKGRRTFLLNRMTRLKQTLCGTGSELPTKSNEGGPQTKAKKKLAKKNDDGLRRAQNVWESQKTRQLYKDDAQHRSEPRERKKPPPTTPGSRQIIACEVVKWVEPNQAVSLGIGGKSVPDKKGRRGEIPARSKLRTARQGAVGS